MRAVCRGAGGGAGRHRRQLLRAGRRQHRVDPAGQPGAAGRAVDHAAGGVPASDRRGAGGGGGRRGGAGAGAAVADGAGLRSAACRRRRSCAGSRSAAGRSTGSASRCCCGCRRGLREEHLTAALQAVLDHHDALRLRLDRGAAGWTWQLEIAPAGAVAAGGLPAAGRCRRGADDAGAARADRRGRRRRPAAADPGGRRMVQAVWFDAGAERPGGCCWRSIILRWTGCRGGSWCRTLRRPGRRCGAGRRSSLPGGAPRSGAGRSGLRRMRGMPSGCGGAFVLARDAERAVAAAGGRAARSGARHAGQRRASDADAAGAVTEALLTRVPAAFHGGINDVLLTGLALAVADWCRRHVQGARVRGAGQGAAMRCCSIWRATAARIGVRRTSICRGRWAGSRAFIRCGLIRAGSIWTRRLPGGAALGRALKPIKEQLRAVPGKGLGYGLLRYLNEATAAAAGRGCRCRSLASTIWAGLRPVATAADWSPASLDARARARRRARLAAAMRRCRWRMLIEINALTLGWGGRPGADGALDVGAGAAR